MTAEPRGRSGSSNGPAVLWRARAHPAATRRASASCLFLPGFHPGNPAVRGQSALIYLPEPARGGHARTILLGGEQCFLKLRRASRNQAPDRDFAGDDATRAELLRQRVPRQILLALKPAKNPIPMWPSDRGRWRPCGFAASLPVCRRRCDHFTALATLTEKSVPPRGTADPTKPRPEPAPLNHSNNANSSHAELQHSNELESDFQTRRNP